MASHELKLNSKELSYRLKWYVNIRWLILLCIAAPNLIIQAIHPSPNSPLEANLIIAGGVFVYNLIFELLVRNRGKAAKYYSRLAVLQIITDILAVTYLAYRNGGIESHAPLLYCLPILVSGIFLTRASMIITALWSAAIFSVVAFIEYNGYIEAPIALNPNLLNDTNGFFNILLFIDSTLVIVSIVGSFFMKLLDRSLFELNKAERIASSYLRQQQVASEAFRLRQLALFDSIGEGLIAFNEYGNVSDVNEAAERILGFRREELIGKWFPKALIAVNEEGDPLPLEKRPMVKAVESGKPVNAKITYVRKNGTLLPVFTTASPYLIDGKPAGGVAVFRDFSHEAAVEKAKDEFVSVTSHQLRTPLTSIRLYAELLTDKDTGSLNAKQSEYLDNINTSTIRMIRLVSDILNLSRIELGRLKVEPKAMALESLIESQIAEMQPIAKEKGLGIVFSAPKPSIPLIKIDENLMNQVIHNLLTNAVRYTPKNAGNIEVGLKKKAEGYELTVKDSGIGIPKEARAKLFSRFFRADNAIAVEGEGSGLGLYLIKQILETSGCKISFESVVNKGTTFCVTIPHKGMRSKKGEVSLASFKDT